MMTMHNDIENQRGAVLVTGILFLAVISIVSGSVYLKTTGDLQRSVLFTDSKAAFYAAEASVEEAKGRLRGPASETNYAGDTATSPDPFWSAYILTSDSWQAQDDPSYNDLYRNYVPTTSSKTNTTITKNSLQNILDYFVKIRHKREYDAKRAGHTTSNPHYLDGDGDTGTESLTADAPGSIIYYGYGDPAAPTTEGAFTGTPGTRDKPVEIITGYGWKGDSRRIVEIEVYHHHLPPLDMIAPATIYSKGNITINGTSGYISGDDNCGGAASKPPIYVKSPAVATGDPTFTGDPAEPQSGDKDIDIQGLVSQMKPWAGEIITEDHTSTGTTFGSSSNFVVCYSDTNDPVNVGGLKISNAVGHGILLVQGDLTLGGGFEWNGLVLVTGTLTFNGGGGGINIFGAVMANSTVDINGGLDLRYDSCMIDDALNGQTGQALRTISWRRIY